MIKSVAFMPRRPDLDRAAFRAYYETRHAPLALRHFRFAHYVRNHLADAQEPGFDCFSEFWHRDVAHTRAQMAGEAGAIMQADELNFIDRPQARPALAEEHLLAGRAREDEAGQAKTILLLRAEAGNSRDTLLDAARAAFAESASRATLDLLAPFDTRPLPYDAVLALWPGADAGFAPPAGWSIGARLPVRAEETSATDLAGGDRPI